MSEKVSNEVAVSDLKFRKIGAWDDIVSISEEISVLLESLNLDNFDDVINEDEFKKVCRKWNEWKPKEGDNFSEEMRVKTAKQSSVGKSELEKKNKKPGEEVQDASDSIKKATKKAKTKDFKAAKEELVDGMKCVKNAVDCGLRKGARAIEESIYEKVILKTNSLYFDNSILNIVLSKNLTAESPKKYQLDLYSNNPRMRELFTTRIDWDGS